MKFVNTFGYLCTDLNPDEITILIKDPACLFNRFTLANSILKYKYSDNIYGT